MKIKPEPKLIRCESCLLMGCTLLFHLDITIMLHHTIKSLCIKPICTQFNAGIGLYTTN